MARKRHSKKEVEAVVDYAIRLGWTLDKATGHTHLWGALLCPRHDRDGCIVPVYSTPQVPQNHAKWIRRQIDRCQHTAPAEPDVEAEGQTEEAGEGEGEPDEDS